MSIGRRRQWGEGRPRSGFYQEVTSLFPQYPLLRTVQHGPIYHRRAEKCGSLPGNHLSTTASQFGREHQTLVDSHSSLPQSHILALPWASSLTTLRLDFLKPSIYLIGFLYSWKEIMLVKHSICFLPCPIHLNQQEYLWSPSLIPLFAGRAYLTSMYSPSLNPKLSPAVHREWGQIIKALRKNFTP